MKPLSIRASLTAWFIGLTVLLLGGFSATLYSSLGRALRTGMDAELRARAEALVGACEWDEEIEGPECKLTQAQAAEIAAGHAGRGLEVWSWPKCELLHQSGDPLRVPDPDDTWDPAQRPATIFANLSEGEPRRLCTLLARAPAVPEHEDDPARPSFEILVRTTESLRPVEAQLDQVAWLILMLGGFSLLVALGFAAFLSRRFVRPLHQLGTAAAAVRAGGKARMPMRGSADEVDHLAEILDGTFSSLEEALNRQTRFTADAAHELRNPVSVIRSAAEVALRNERSTAEYREFLADVLATADRMGSIIEGLLLLARMDAGAIRGTFVDVDLLAIARACAAALDGSAERIRVAEGEPVVIRGEAELLRILTDNLLLNALRYSDGKPVQVVVGRGRSGEASLSVRDFGPGVPEHAKALIFERFYRVEAARAQPSGAGLGLSIVAEVARLHSAECDVQDAAPGTRVTVRFRQPRAPLPSRAARGSSASPS